jgi:CBS-domain-containing membrane protein
MTVQVAVGLMSEKNFGSVVVTDNNQMVIGVLTERDILKKLVNERKGAEETLVSEIMTKDVKVARETDDVLDWLRIMSNERFRRLPVVDDSGRVVCVFTQGDFVSYTWPDLLFQAKELAKAGVMKNFSVWLIGGGLFLYSVLMLGVIVFMSSN